MWRTSGFKILVSACVTVCLSVSVSVSVCARVRARVCDCVCVRALARARTRACACVCVRVHACTWRVDEIAVAGGYVSVMLPYPTNLCISESERDAEPDQLGVPAFGIASGPLWHWSNQP